MRALVCARTKPQLVITVFGIEASDAQLARNDWADAARLTIAVGAWIARAAHTVVVDTTRASRPEC